jgi:hypothetical protein
MSEPQRDHRSELEPGRCSMPAPLHSEDPA